jgi:hypothetical protein
MTELLLKASAISGAGLLFYKGVLQGESFFAANRAFLAGCIVLAFLLPHLDLPPLVRHQGYLGTLLRTAGGTDAPGVTSRGQPAEAVTPSPGGAQPSATSAAPSAGKAEPGPRGWWYWVEALYGFGAAVLTLNLLFQAGTLLRRAATSPDKVRDGGCTIVNTATRQAPSSFFGYIFIHPADYDYPTYEQIIAHERVHARLWHTLDLLLAEVAVIVLWFNPLAWLLRREIEKNLEYQTDAALLAAGAVDQEAYQLSLLRIAAPDKPLSLTTNYNQSLLKQRILMMNAKRSTPHRYWKYAFMAPLFFGALLLLNEPAASQNAPAVADAPQPTPSPAPAGGPVPVEVPVAVPDVNAVGRGTGNRTADKTVREEERPLSPFHSLAVSGLAVVYLSHGETGKARLEVSGMPIEDVITQVEGGVLTVTTRGQHNGESIKVYVSSPALKAIAVDGAGILYSENTLRAGRLEISLLGSGAAKLDVDAGDLKVNMNGGDLDLTGKARSYEVFHLENSSRGRLLNPGLHVGE